ncbi:sulfatase family protein [Pontiella sulfatireligans]|uniref:Arylsulfatase n=1 Tax=Pontiella sulfatireligans TaxID=2750658 RepID=A0A6C2UI43_9BACT|nr:arylsulfatase [Pontiella sulfatireligans]SPS74395.1 sulfatase S1_15 [Kiritimatiellales bacterium]VGO19798.1 Arylsulfatase [Pontiella sulfatireligans]
MKKLFTAFLLIASGASAAQKPNIVLIMADDLGLGDLSHYTRTQMDKEPLYETPAIDYLAQQGLWFTDGHSATSLCSPTRYCVMSGNNNYRSYAPWGVWGTFRETAFKDGEVTLGSVVKDGGYNTGFIGKWHLGGDFLDKNTGKLYRGGDHDNPDSTVDLSKFVDHGPKFCGFDYDFTLPCGIQGPIYTCFENEQWYPLKKDSKIIYLDDTTALHPKDVSDKGFGLGDSNWDTSKIGDIISAKAVGFINTNAKKKAPFFLYYCSPMVHIPHCPPDEFDGKKIKGATPSRHLDMVLDLDQQVRRIVAALKAKGVYDNTLIVFTSDNGGLSIDKDTAKAGHKSSGQWSGAKNSPLEGGHRVPFFAVWPGHIKPGTTDEPAINQDMLATFAALVGTQVPKDQAQDSNNLLPLLLGKNGFKQRNFIVMQAGSQNEVMYRKWPWKLIIQSDHQCSKWEPKALYNLKDNPTENRKFNFVKNPEYKQLVEKMKKEYLEIRTSGQRTAP